MTERVTPCNIDTPPNNKDQPPWGSMTSLRAASRRYERGARLGARLAKDSAAGADRLVGRQFRKLLELDGPDLYAAAVGIAQTRTAMHRDAPYVGASGPDGSIIEPGSLEAELPKATSPDDRATIQAARFVNAVVDGDSLTVGGIFDEICGGGRPAGPTAVTFLGTLVYYAAN